MSISTTESKESDKTREITEYAEKHNILLSKEAIPLLKENNFREIIDQLVKENELFVNEETVRKKIAGSLKNPLVEVRNTSFKPESKDVESRFRLMTEYDVTGQSCSEGTVENFLELFRSKYKLLKEILEKRHTLSPKPLNRLKSVPVRHDVDVIGMVSEKWVTKNENIAIRIEDLDASCIVIVSQKENQLFRLADYVMLDDVIGVKATKLSNEILIAKEILWPDLTIKTARTSERDISFASISDVHMGSKLFLEKSFNKFLSWIQGNEGGEKEKELVGKIKYLFVTGDNVDGVGIYPSQFDELSIKDIYEQYEEFSKLMLQIPEHIEVIINPGQHDAVRWADPQPAIAEKYLPDLHKAKNIHLVGSPSWIEIEGLKVLVYHGAAYHDLYASITGLNPTNPSKAMIELLKKRDIMPSYGLNQPYVPEKKDFMIIKEEPDFFLSGDMHHKDYGSYRGTTAISNGCFQGRTDYQKKLGHVPTPGIAITVNLKSRNIFERNFYKGEDNG